LDYVFEIIKTAELGGDWRTLVNQHKEEQKKKKG